jgi:hypothetical protein
MTAVNALSLIIALGKPALVAVAVVALFCAVPAVAYEIENLIEKHYA